jgi:glutathione S-transferase
VDDDPNLIFHLAIASEWMAALESGTPYSRSTLGQSVEEIGFMHCSTRRQVRGVADAFYRGRNDVMLLIIDVTKVDAEIRRENLDGGSEMFPHIYGFLPLDAVVSAEAIRLGPDGALELGF